MSAPSVMGMHPVHAAMAAGNPWGGPPVTCRRQQSRPVVCRAAAALSSCSSNYQPLGMQLKRTSGRWQGYLNTALAGRQHGQHAGSIRVGFSAGTHSMSSSSRSSKHTPLLPFPAVSDPQEQVLCGVLRVQPYEAQLLLLACPAVSTMPAADLAANWQLLQQLLPLPQQKLLQAMLQIPSLLAHPKKTVHARLAESAKVLGLSVGQLKARRREQTAQLQWRLLVTPRQQLEQQLVQVVQLLGGLQQQQVVRLVCAEPKLLGRDPAQLLSTVEALEQICGCPLARLLQQLRGAPRLLVATADSLYRAAASLQQLLRLSEEGLTLVVRRAPAALLVPTASLRDLLEQLPPALSVSPEIAADILLQEPQLLVRSAGAILGVLGVLRSRYRLSAEVLLQVVQFDPSILLLSPGQLSEETKHFKLLAASHPVWAAEYKYLMSRPANVARALRIEPLRLQRLVFLSRQGMAGSINLRNALTLSGCKFVSLYPRYPAWLAQVYSSGNPPKRYAAAAAVDTDDEDSEDDSNY